MAMKHKVTLTEEEKQMLAGELGAAKQKALEFIVQYADAVGAERLVEIRKAHIFVGAHHYLQVLKKSDIDDIISEMYLNTSDRVVLEKVSCFTQTDVAPVDPDNWEALGISPEKFEADRKHHERFRAAGTVEGGSCASYMVGFIPMMGEHYVSTESHALLFMNSMWGARANADSIEASICSAVCGRTPLWGNHLPEKRRGTHLVVVETSPRTVHEWDLLGYAIGEKLSSNWVPVLVGDFEPPDLERLKSCFASMATSGSVEMCHIVGLTPEAQTLDAALQGHKPDGTIRITRSDIASVIQKISQQGRAKIGFVSLGCPHYSLKQIQEVAEWMRGKKVHPGMIFQVWTAIPIKESAKRSGFVEAIEKSGGRVLTSSCPLVTQAIPDVPAMAFDSVKQGKYIQACTQSQVFVGSTEQCLEAAVTGIWKGDAA
jgi:cis-L-3-hydroxyproline dehydratase